MILHRSNGSVVVTVYPNGACGSERSLYFELDKTALSTGSCQQDFYRFYSSDGNSAYGFGSSTNCSGDRDSSSHLGTSTVIESSSSGSHDPRRTRTSNASSVSVGSIIGIAVAVLAVVLVLALYVRHHLRKNKKGEVDEDGESFNAFGSPQAGHKHASATSPSEDDQTKPLSLVGLWDDEVIATARIPREKVVTHRPICHGGGGEVHLGRFNEQQVAVKMLPPELRKSVQHVNAFLAEAKFMATLDHPRIVQFVGVAWDSLTDLCVVSELMEGGDLRALLSSYAANNYPKGFDRSKVTIALHTAHALTCLHSLETPVLHRDLKSKNVMLTSDLEAKLADFSISRERVDETMSAAVGTSLWMAPEVMLGERYDDKADMFSFGVVLSELDVHTLPYAHAVESGDRIPSETVILQKIALGQFRVEFSMNSLQSVVDLGVNCVCLDPKQRPTAAEALYRLHTILKEL